jgi:hypothetical protein
MAREWGLEAKSGRNGRTLEGMLIEVYGCMPLSDRVINLYANRDAKRVTSDFYTGDHNLEGMLIEVYGCMPLNDNRVINLYASRDRKREQKALYFSEQLVDSKAV